MGSARPRLKHEDSLPTETLALEKDKWRRMQGKKRKEDVNH